MTHAISDPPPAYERSRSSISSAFHKLCFALSLALCVLSVVLFATPGLNFGIDFLGGTLIEARTPQGRPISPRCAAKLDALNLGEVALQEFGSARDVLIRVARQPGGEARQMKAVQAIREAPRAGVEYRRVEVVGPKVGSELIRAGVLATVLSLGGIARLRRFRFEWHSRLRGVIAIFHDADHGRPVRACRHRVQPDDPGGGPDDRRLSRSTTRS